MAQIHEAIAAIMGEVGAISKENKNSAQGYYFRGIDDVYIAVHNLFAKHGVFSVPTVLESVTEEKTSTKGSTLIYRILKIRYDFFAKDGSSISATVIGEGMDSGDKASNKAMSVAHKYAILQLLAIPTEDTVDPEIDSHEVKPRPAPESTYAIEDYEKLKELDVQLGKIMTATVGAVAAFTDSEREPVRTRRAAITKVSAESVAALTYLVNEYRDKLEALRAAWIDAGSPTPRPENLMPKEAK